jgi:hypothetical protein
MRRAGEQSFLSQVTVLADSMGLLWHHCHDSRLCEGTPGFPDLVIAGPGGILFRELKSGTGETTPGQELWLWTLNGSLRTSVWRPADLEAGIIRAELEALLDF